MVPPTFGRCIRNEMTTPNKVICQFCLLCLPEWLIADIHFRLRQKMCSRYGNVKECQCSSLRQSPHLYDITAFIRGLRFFPNGWLKVRRSMEGGVYQRAVFIRGNAGNFSAGFVFTWLDALSLS